MIKHCITISKNKWIRSMPFEGQGHVTVCNTNEGFLLIYKHKYT